MGWLVGLADSFRWLIGWVFGWVGCLIGWLLWLIGWLIFLLVDCFG